MAAPIKTRLIKIGNSQGIRIPRLLIEQAGLSDDVELEAQSGRLVVRPSRSARKGWDEAFQHMAGMGDDRLLDGESSPPTAWETDEWQW